MAGNKDSETQPQLSPFEQAADLLHNLHHALRDKRSFERTVPANIAALVLRIPAEELTESNHKLTVFGVVIGPRGVTFEITPPSIEKVNINVLKVNQKERTKYLRKWYVRLATAFQNPISDEVATIHGVSIIRELAQPMGLTSDESGVRLPSMFDISGSDIYLEHSSDFKEMERIYELTNPDIQERITRDDLYKFLQHFYNTVRDLPEAETLVKYEPTPQQIMSAVTGSPIHQIS